jgi:hypothetical protein
MAFDKEFLDMAQKAKNTQSKNKKKTSWIK